MDERIKNAIEYISQNIDKQLELSDVAGAVFISPYHFHRIFKKEFGLPLKKFIQNYKLEKAYLMVTNTALNIGDIADQLGYKNYETFSRAFKRHHKVSPDDLKAIIQKAFENRTISEGESRKVLLVVSNKETESADLIPDALEDLMARDINKNELTQPVVLVVRSANAKTAATNQGEKVVKNKYGIKDKSKDWREAVRKMKDENLLRL